jgi:hypothetical protein
MDLLQTYHKVNSILDGVNFNTLFEGFHKYRFALYSSKEIILDGQVLPPREDFRGNTAKEYEGEYIAIWNMEFDPVEAEERLAYLLVHEMFHCHQHTNNESRFPSDLDLLNYPEDVDNFTKKYNENRYLADAYEQQDTELFRNYVSIRIERYEKYPSMVCQEWKAETLEGMAEYIGLKALKQINAVKYISIVDSYMDKLREESKLLFDVRRISYYTGAVYFLCLERLGMPVRNDFGSELTAFEQTMVDTKGITVDLIFYDFVPKKYEELATEKEGMIKQHIEKANYTECHAFICGYDPMNIFRQGNLIYCKHFVCLNENGVVKTFTSLTVLKMAEKSNREVAGYYR